MDRMTTEFNKAINEGYRNGNAVIVFSSTGDLLHGREELEASVQSGKDILGHVIYGIDREAWNLSEWPEILEAARQVFYSKEI